MYVVPGFLDGCWGSEDLMLLQHILQQLNHLSSPKNKYLEITLGTAISVFVLVCFVIGLVVFAHFVPKSSRSRLLTITSLSSQICIIGTSLCMCSASLRRKQKDTPEEARVWKDRFVYPLWVLVYILSYFMSISLFPSAFSGCFHLKHQTGRSSHVGTT